MLPDERFESRSRHERAAAHRDEANRFRVLMQQATTPGMRHRLERFMREHEKLAEAELAPAAGAASERTLPQ